MLDTIVTPITFIVAVSISVMVAARFYPHPYTGYIATAAGTVTAMIVYLLFHWLIV